MRGVPFGGSQLSGLFEIAVQYLKFGIVGVVATAVHASLFVSAVRIGVEPVAANISAFCVAVVGSFVGHFHWTFRADPAASDVDPRQRSVALLKFIAVALIGLGLNSAGVYVVAYALELDAAYAVLFMVFVVPPVVFILNRLWAFA